MAPTTQRSAATSAPQNQANKSVTPQLAPVAITEDGIAVNRKKQKRREKQAARLAVEESSKLGHTLNGHGSPHPSYDRPNSQAQASVNGLDYGVSDAEDLYGSRGPGDLYYSDEDSR